MIKEDHMISSDKVLIVKIAMQSNFPLKTFFELLTCSSKTIFTLLLKIK